MAADFGHCCLLLCQRPPIKLPTPSKCHINFGSRCLEAMQGTIGRLNQIRCFFLAMRFHVPWKHGRNICKANRAEYDLICGTAPELICNESLIGCLVVCVGCFIVLGRIYEYSFRHTTMLQNIRHGAFGKQTFIIYQRTTYHTDT